VPGRSLRKQRSTIVLIIGVALGSVAGCASGSSGPDSSTSISAPPPTPTTANEVRELTQRIPLDGNAMAPIRWKLPALKAPALKEPLLTVRQYLAVQRFLYTQENPSFWIPHLMATGTEPAESAREEILASSPLPWDQRLIGPSWIWIMNARMASAEKTQITYCADYGWQGKPAAPPTRHMGTGGIETLEVTYLKDYPGRPIWKVTDYWPLDEDPFNRPYVKQCEAWQATHTSTEGWTIPAAPAMSATGSPRS
jgi:hypothetical protein